MQVITTHTSTDFDALAAMLAASKLYPNAALYFPGHLSRSVKSFYSLYKDTLPIKAPEMLHLGTVSELIVVDTQQPERIGRFKELLNNPKVKVTIYDHHPTTSKSIRPDSLHCEEVGAATSLLVEMIKDRNIELTALEATVMALGIYADTACLTTPATSPKDLLAAAYLLEQGADLELIGRYARGSLTDGQRQLLEHLLTGSEEYTIHGIKVLLSTCSVEEYIDGLAVLAQRLADVRESDLIFLVVEMDDRIHVVGRSRANHLAVNEIMEGMGGGGHPQAASATVKGKSLNATREWLLEQLRLSMRPPVTARDLMSMPVHTANPEMSMAEAGKAMLRFGHSGLPVTDNGKGKILGVISRRDVDKANHHGLMHAPVKAFMSTSVVTIHEDASLDDVQRTLTGRDIGRLPVVGTDGQLKGIVTRTDVLRALHGRSYPHWYQTNLRPSAAKPGRQQEFLTELLADRLPGKLQGKLWLIGQEAERQGVRAYLVGGVVRDLLLDVPNFDVDIVVEPEAIPFAESLAKKLGAELKTYPQFNTATLVLPDGQRVDLVTARTEFYANPAAMPDVELSTIKQDLYRRDFTINTLAIKLNTPEYGLLLDFFGGRPDLHEGVVRVLFNLSFVEDPTRILRAIRFEQRYQFTIESESLRFLRNALENDLLQKVSQERLRQELRSMLEEVEAPRILLRMDELGAMRVLLPELVFTDTLIHRLKQAGEQLGWFSSLQPGHSLNAPLVYLLILSAAMPPNSLESLKSLAFSKKEADLLAHFGEEADAFAKALLSSEDNSAVYRTIEPWPLEYQVAAAITHGEAVRDKLSHYWTELAHVKPESKGDDLLQLGLRPGPRVGKILQALHNARLNGLVDSKEAELALARKLLASPEEGR